MSMSIIQTEYHYRAACVCTMFLKALTYALGFAVILGPCGFVQIILHILPISTAQIPRLFSDVALTK